MRISQEISIEELKLSSERGGPLSLSSPLIESYELDLKVDFEKGVIFGSVVIHARDVGPGTFELDADELEITRCQIENSDISYEYDRQGKKIRFHALPSKGNGKIDLAIDYIVQVSDKSTTGVYKSHYGQSEYIIATDLEPDHASKLLPCDVNPSSKSVYNVSVTTDSRLKVISNSEILKVEELGSQQKRRTTFRTTPKMSAYLLFVAIGKFEEKSTIKENKNGTEIILATRPGMLEGNSDFILKTSFDALKESERYYRVPYPLPKLHLVALPEYNTGAMENWGAISSRESMVLVADNATVFETWTATIGMVHEIQHQWFGDLVTMKWWDDLWLNESFATFMSYKIIDRLFPEWRIFSSMLVLLTFESMNLDVLSTTHPVEAKINSPNQISQLFDRISYGKGASVLRMVESFMGEEAFRNAISSYIKRFSYSNAAGADLWRSLEEESRGEPISHVMESWITTKGFPLLNVRKSGNKLNLSQERFLLSPENDSTNLWPVPMTIRINKEQKRFLMDQREREIDLDADSLITDINLNVNQTGYYVTLYDESLYDLIAKRFETFNDYEKAGMMNDLFQLLKARRIEPELYFRFVELLSDKHEGYGTVWSVANQLRLLDAIANESRLVRNAIIKFFSSQMAFIGTKSRKGESSGDSALRELVASELASHDLEFAQRLAPEFEKLDLVEPNMRLPVISAYAKVSGREGFEKLEGMLKKSKNERDRIKIYAGVSKLESPELVERILDLSTSGEVSRSDVFYPLFCASYNGAVRRTVWRWIKKNIETVSDIRWWYTVLYRHPNCCPQGGS
jgi:tricorn protease interacting factor F2/3